LAAIAAKPADPADEHNADAIFFGAWRSVSLALFQFRRGDSTAAVDWCHRCLSSPDNNPARNATARIILAETSRQPNEAESSLSQGRQEVDGRLGTDVEMDVGSREQGFWFDWVFARILLREAVSAPDTASVSGLRRGMN
jgi:hypothetical protein